MGLDLPDLFLGEDGQRVETVEAWERHREYLLRLLCNEVYGSIPVEPSDDAVKIHILREDDEFLDGRATLKEVEIKVLEHCSCKLNMLLVTPNSSRLCPVFLGMNFFGNHTVIKDEGIYLTERWIPICKPHYNNHRASGAERGKASSRWCVEHLVDNGYGIGTMHHSDIFADRRGGKDDRRQRRQESSRCPTCVGVCFAKDGRRGCHGPCHRLLENIWYGTVTKWKSSSADRSNGHPSRPHHFQRFRLCFSCPLSEETIERRENPRCRVLLPPLVWLRQRGPKRNSLPAVCGKGGTIARRPAHARGTSCPKSCVDLQCCRRQLGESTCGVSIFTTRLSGTLQ